MQQIDVHMEGDGARFLIVKEGSTNTERANDRINPGMPNCTERHPCELVLCRTGKETDGGVWHVRVYPHTHTRAHPHTRGLEMCALTDQQE